MFSQLESFFVRHKLPKNMRNLPLRIKLWDGKSYDVRPNPTVTLIINDEKMVDEISTSSFGDLGSAYVEGRIDLEGSMLEIIKFGDLITEDNNDGYDPYDHKEHKKEEDAEAISYHYDVSNDFYKLWLDSQMAYSCAYFKTGKEDLETAQLNKFEHLCRKLRLKKDEYLLDVGCGWGGLSCYAAKNFGVKVLGITLSKEQFDEAQKRVDSYGLSDRVEIKLMDYRDLPQDERFDKIVSVGMLEHVGLANLPQYCKILSNAVKPGGIVLNHGITSSATNDKINAAGSGGDFIEKYVFPHGELPHLATLISNMSDADLEVLDVESLRLHYARTLELWSDNLEKRLEEASKMVSPRILRIWRLYLAGCAYAFSKGWINIDQVVSVKPLENGEHNIGWSREDLYK